MSGEPTGAQRPSRRSVVVHLGLAAVVLAGLAAATAASWRIEAWRAREREEWLRRIPTIAGTVERHPTFHSAVLGATRGVSVYLPPQYAVEPERRFPVLYLLDGRSAFDGALAERAGEEWQVDEAAERLVREQEIEPLIVVAVDGPKRANPGKPVSGGPAEGRMLLEELRPWIDRTYRTTNGRGPNAVGGCSRGAALALEVGLGNPGAFPRIAALSPAAGLEVLIRLVDALPSKPETVVWLDVGSAEGTLPAARRLRDALLRKGWRAGVDLSYAEAQSAGTSPACAERVPGALRFLFPTGR